MSREWIYGQGRICVAVAVALTVAIPGGAIRP